MRASWRTARTFRCLLATLLMLVVGPAASALASTSVRFVHAVPGAPAAQLNAGDTAVGSEVGFGTETSAVEVEPGEVELRLSAEGDEELATATQNLEDGESYTVVALARGEGAELRVYPDGQAEPGRASVRMIHATPELGEPDVRLDDRVIAEGLAYREATDYATVRPGTYDMAFVPPNGGDPLAERNNVPLSAGTATTGIVAGSRGEETTVLILEDDAVAPRSAPDTGLGGLAESGDGGRTLLILLIGLGAGVLGAGGYGLASAGARRGRAG